MRGCYSARRDLRCGSAERAVRIARLILIGNAGAFEIAMADFTRKPDGSLSNILGYRRDDHGQSRYLVA
jgi:hypothetical protein